MKTHCYAPEKKFRFSLAFITNCRLIQWVWPSNPFPFFRIKYYFFQYYVNRDHHFVLYRVSPLSIQFPTSFYLLQVKLICLSIFHSSFHCYVFFNFSCSNGSPVLQSPYRPWWSIGIRTYLEENLKRCFLNTQQGTCIHEHDK